MSSSSSSRRDGRRSVSDSDPSSLQYLTLEGGYPVNVARRQADAMGDPRVPQRSRYPREYRNQEGRPPNTHENFDPRTTLRPGERYYEMPVIPPTSPSHFDPDRRPASLAQVSRPVHPNDRGRVVQHPPNDPGKIRQVVAAGPSGGASRPVGLMEHATSATGSPPATTVPP
ncbi:hypothetical protein VTK56DRAFT_3008 [Thermocarpiscus australiensis]